MPIQRLLTVLVLIAAAATATTSRAQGLVDLYQQALNSNPNFKSTGFSLEQARAERTQARSPLLPQLSIRGSYSDNTYDEGFSRREYVGKRASLQGRQALFDLTNYFLLKSAKSTVLQREEEREETRMTLAGVVIDQYLEILSTSDELDYLQAEKETTLEQLERLRFMHDRKLAKITDLYEIEAYQQGLLTREIEARNAQAIAFERLRATTGSEVLEVMALTPENLPTVPGDEQQWLADAIANNRTLVALRHAINAASQLISSARARHLPQVALTATYTDSNQGFDSRDLPSYSSNSIGVEITIPLYEGGRVDGSVRAARARHGIAQQEYEFSLRETEVATRTAYLNALASYARIGSTTREINSLEKVLDAQRKGYDLGTTTLVDVLIAQRRLFRARSDRSKVRYDYLRNLTSLRIQAGNLTFADIEELDRLLNGIPRSGKNG